MMRHKTIEIRRHAERHKPGDNLNTRGVTRARNASARNRAFARVISSPIARAVQTAVGMGHAVDWTDWTLADMGGRVSEAIVFDAGFAAIGHAIRTDPAAAAYARLQAIELRHHLGHISPGEALLVVSHGGVAEAGIIGLLGDADVAALGPSFDYCEGARIELDGDAVRSVRLLRFESDRETEVDAVYNTPNRS